MESGKRVYKNIDKSYIERNIEELSRHKIFISKADGAAGQIGYPIPARILGKSEIAGVNTACTETFLRIGPFDSEQECKNVKSYIETKFFRCLVGARKNKNMTQSTYSFVPIQDFSKSARCDHRLALFLDFSNIATMRPSAERPRGYLTDKEHYRQDFY